jgi:hypothetical protein
MLSYEIWRDSYRPCTEFQKFLSKTIIYGRDYESGWINDHTLDCKVATIDGVIRTHQGLCEQFAALHQEVCERKASGSLQEDHYPCIDTRNPQAYRLMALFRALVIVILDTQQSPDDQPDRMEAGQPIPVKLVCTGLNDGLDIPIDLSEVSSTVDDDGGYIKVTTTLTKALRFISNLEQRQSKVEERQNSELRQKNAVDIPQWGPIGGGPPEEFLKNHGYKYSGPLITPELLIQYCDMSVYPDTLDGLRGKRRIYDMNRDFLLRPRVRQGGSEEK